MEDRRRPDASPAERRLRGKAATESGWQCSRSFWVSWLLPGQGKSTPCLPVACARRASAGNMARLYPHERVSINHVGRVSYHDPSGNALLRGLTGRILFLTGSWIVLSLPSSARMSPTQDDTSHQGNRPAVETLREPC